MVGTGICRTVPGSVFRGLLLMALLVPSFGCGWQDRVIFAGAYERPDATRPAPLDAITLRVETGPGAYTEAWLLPPAPADPGPHPMVVFLHGNGERIDDWVDRLRPYRRVGCAVLLVEFRGYGDSGGTPSEQNIVADTCALIDLAKQRPDVDARRVVIHGRSLGGAVAALVAARSQPRGLILESAPADLGLITEKYLVARWLVRYRFRGAAALQGLEIPTLILHGTRDRIVPIRHAEAYAAAVPNARTITYECGHNSMPWHSDAYWSDVVTFLRQLVEAPPSGPGK